MTKAEAFFLWTAVWIYGLGFISFLFGVVFKRDRWLRYGWYISFAGFIIQSVSMGIRWIEAGHPPVMREYENSLLGSWFIMVLFIIIRAWQKRMEIIGVLIIPVVLLMIGHGTMENPVIEPFSPPYKSNWLWFHVFFAWIAYGAFCIGAGLGLLYLLKERGEKKGKENSLFARLPELRALNDLTLRIIIFGFVALTTEIGVGAIWAYGLWGRYWGWDPIETWSLITWLAYGTYIHLGATLGWKGRRMAWLAILALLFVFITFGGIGFLGGVHTTIL